jgi:acyl carrier protein
MDSEIANIKQKVKRELSDFLGIDAEDIEDETVLIEDLHMDPANLADFAEILEKGGFDTTSLDFTQVETFLDLIEALTEHQ